MSSRTHGQSKTPEFRVWTYIKNRCYNRNDPKFRYYGHPVGGNHRIARDYDLSEETRRLERCRDFN